MPSLDAVVRDICTGCAKAGQVVNGVLAAFVARTVRILMPPPSRGSKEATAFPRWRRLSALPRLFIPAAADSLPPLPAPARFRSLRPTRGTST